MDKQTELNKMTAKLSKPTEPEKQKKETVFHVAFSEVANKIYAGTVNKKGTMWLKRTDVTEECMVAVRDHFMKIKTLQEENTSAVGYQWTSTDGKTVTLQLVITDPSLNEAESEG